MRRSADELLMIAAGPAPCDGCRFSARCASVPLACRAFAAYVNGSSKWQGMAREPVDGLFERIFRGEDLRGGRPPKAPAARKAAPVRKRRSAPSSGRKSPPAARRPANTQEQTAWT